jgi:hypothetical protein
MGSCLHLPEDNCKAVQVADFLRALLRHRRGHVIVLWAYTIEY